MSLTLLPGACLSVLPGGKPRSCSRLNILCPFLSFPSHLHNVMVHLQQENKKLKTEIEEKKLKTGHPRLCTKALGPSKTEPIPKGKACATLGWRGTSQDMSQRMDITKFVRIPHCSGILPFVFCYLYDVISLSPTVQKNSNSLILFFKGSLHWEFKVGAEGQIFCLATLD